MDIPNVQMIASAGDEERRCGAAGKEALPARSILFKHFPRRRMDRDQTRLAEFGAANRQYTCLQIDILGLETDRLANPHAGHAALGGAGCVCR